MIRANSDGEAEDESESGGESESEGEGEGEDEGEGGGRVWVEGGKYEDTCQVQIAILVTIIHVEHRRGIIIVVMRPVDVGDLGEG